MKGGAGTRSWASALAGAALVLSGLTLLVAIFPLEDSHQVRAPEPLRIALLLGLGALLLALGVTRIGGGLLALLSGAALTAKPIAFPLTYRSDVLPLPLTSETHLYYVIPGLGLGLLGMALVLARLPSPGRVLLGVRDVTSGLLCSVATLFLLASFFGSPTHHQADVIPLFLLPGLITAIATIVILVRDLPRDLRGPSPTALESASGREGRLEFDVETEPLTKSDSMDEVLRAVAEAPAISPATPGVEDMVGRSVGHFELTQHLGSGGMGRVYRARDKHLLRDVAFKVLPAGVAHDVSRRERLLREARAAARITHPNVATIYEVSADGDFPYIVMELAEGTTLRQILSDGGRREQNLVTAGDSDLPGLGVSLALPQERAWLLATKIAEGLAAAHAQGVVHRDLKPDNVIVTVDDDVKILDFGLARFGTDPNSAPSTTSLDGSPMLTQAGQVLGTPAYMSPEQADGGIVDARSDVFSFGVLLFELHTGCSPFVRPTPHDSREALRQVTLPDGWEQVIPNRALGVLLRCLCRNPSDRFDHGGELAAAMRDAV